MKLQYLALIGAVLTFGSCRHTTQTGKPLQAIRVKTEPVRSDWVSLPIVCSGLVSPSRETRLSFKTGGIIAHIYVEEGALVKKGDMLASLNLMEIQAQSEQVKSVYNKAIRDLQRVKNLYTDSVATLEQLQNAQTAADVAKSNVAMVSFNLGHSVILAPDDGTILKRLAETDEMIAPGYPVFLFGTEGKSWKIKTGLADRDFVRVAAGDSARVSIDAYPGRNFQAVVRRISAAASTATGTYEAELDLQAPGYKLATGMVANVRIFPAHKVLYWMIPIESVVDADGQSGYVYVVNDSLVAHRVSVRIATFVGDRAAVSEGLDRVKSIVSLGAAYLSDGDKVALVK